jgi:two-component system sensor histidine kinase BaeS
MVLVTCLVAAVSVAITAAVALPLGVRAANEAMRDSLGERARLAAVVMEGRNTPGAAAREDTRARRVAATLRSQGVDAVLILAGQPDVAGLPAAVVERVAAGDSVSDHIIHNGRRMLVEGRPAGTGDGIVLLQLAASASTARVLGRLWLALMCGLAAGVLAGLLLARRIVRPLRAVAATARRLSGGDRGARAPADTTAEVADVASALNDLAAALATSENRQRTFLMSVSHELRTPLTTIRGYAEALADGVITADAQRTGQTMLAEAEHLDRMVEDLLVLARLEADDFPLEIMPVEVVSLLSNLAESWSARFAAAGVLLRTEFPPHAVFVRTDPGRVRQVVDGLLGNALRVVPPGAPVVLAVRAEHREEETLPFPVVGSPPPPARVRPAPDGMGGRPYVEIEVRDGGPGFTDDDLAVVFERGALYERYKGVRKVGSGLGLALAARLIARLGGEISAGHAPEGGARMTLRLPAGD